MGDGDGWVTCTLGHRHWGRHGAAGVLITDGERSVLQHRAPWTHEGDTWGVPGGARDSHEDVVTAALREAHEEAGIAAAAMRPIGLLVDDHGGWSYTSIIAWPQALIVPKVANAESGDIRWWDNREVDSLALHRGFAGTWPRLHTPPPRLVLLVDTTDPSDPDHPAATDLTGLCARLVALARDGIRAGDLPLGIRASNLDVLLPRIFVISPDPAAVTRHLELTAHGGWWRRAISAGPPGWLHEAWPGRYSAGVTTQTVAVTGSERARPEGSVRVSSDWLLNLPLGSAP